MSNRRSSIDVVVSGSPTPDEWRQFGPLIDAVLEAAPDQRAAILTELSSGDAARRAGLERMVAECEWEYPLMERTAGERFTALFSDEASPVLQSLTERYQIIRELGRGGMAIVYVARDLRHGRDVAVKVVRPELAAEGRARFLHEIRIAARLRHLHIVPLYDSGESDGVLYYVMPYEGGHSLRERLARDGPLPLGDVVLMLRDVCDALAYAHAHGIVHRDIKPDNILLSGRHALVTDFGVARAMSEATAGTVGETTAGSSAVSALATGGRPIGTPAYMAPEQLTADAHVDHRADIFAVGILAYELLTGRLPFADVERQQGLPAHLIDAPASLKGLRPDVPDALAMLISKCMEKNAADRSQTADELLVQLEAMAGGTDRTVRAETGRTWATRSLAVLTIGAMLVAAFVAVLTRNRASPPQISLGRASQLTSEPGLEVQPSLSPDGRHVAYAAGNSLQMRILVRPTAGGRPVRLTSDTTENEWFPRWSPDGTRVLFLSRGGVFSAPASGGPARPEIVPRPGTIVTSATWSPDGREIAYVRGDSLLARTVATGNVRTITVGGELHSCSWAPNGSRLACVSGNYYYVTVGTIFGLGPMFGNLAPSRIVVVPALGGDRVSVTDSGSLHQSPVWSSDGRTLYYVSNRQGPRDVYARDVSGAAVRAKPVRITTGLGAHSISFSSTGAQIVYAVYRSIANVWAVMIPTDPPGSDASAVPVTTGNQTVEGVRVSPDGRFVVYDSDLRGNSDVYRVSVTGGEPERLTSSPLDEFRGAISPSGKELTYHSFQSGSRNMFMIPVDGGAVQQLTSSTGQLSMANWSPDGNALALFDMVTSEVLVMRRDARGRWGSPGLVARNGWRPEWSPDGRNIAFISPTDGRIGVTSLDSGSQRDLYVPGAGDPMAELAVYAANGGELYFKSHDARGRASFWSIRTAGGRPRLLLRLDDPARASNRFEFASDGKRFYFTVEDRQSDIWLAEVTGH